MLLTEKTKEATLQEKLNKKRNLFGLGLTSLIAACGSDAATNAGGGSVGETEEERIAREAREAEEARKAEEAKRLADEKAAQEARADALPVKALALSEDESGFTATKGGDTNSFIVELSDSTGTIKTLNFAEGKQDNRNSAGLYKLTPNVDQYDLVIASYTFNQVDSSDPEYQKGRIFIYWDIESITDSPDLEIKGAKADDRIGTFAPEFFKINDSNNYYMVIRSHLVDRPVDASTYIENAGAIYILWDVIEYIGESKTIDLGASNNDNGDFATSGSLAIYGATAGDQIGAHGLHFLQLGGTDNNHDMAIRSHLVKGEKGAIYILWDVADYAGENRGITLDNDLSDEATAGSLTIYGGRAEDKIGTHAPEFLQLGGTDNDYDMVIRSGSADKFAYPSYNTGAIYILWDVADYAGENRGITLDNDLAGEATAGSLTIYGTVQNDQIGTHASKFLQIAGEADNYDMVIRSQWHDQPEAENFGFNNHGAIYILWDVADYAGENKTINLGTLGEVDPTDSLGKGATSGSLAIYGAKKGDYLGTHASEFLQIGGEADNYDMVISARLADNGSSANTGAIYILWDLVDYYGTGADKNKSIDLTPADATSGLLTIYGRAAHSDFGREDNVVSNNILYDTAADGSKSLTNIDGDTAGTIDIAFRDSVGATEPKSYYTYILFGDKVANDADGDDKVDSKTVDLAVIEAALGANAVGFFSYNFDAHEAAFSSIDAEDRVGYRFAGRKADLAAVQADYTAATSPTGPLSDTDSDLGVWDIA